MIVCGSYITGNPSKHSDIDIHIILSSDTKWRERGNEIIDGILIEYFANPMRKYSEYALSDFNRRRLVMPHMFYTGKILFDKTGELKEIVRYSRKYINKKYPKQNKIPTEMAKYHLWDMLDNLEEVHDSNGEEFEFVFHVFLNDMFEMYSKFLRFDSILANKLRRFLANENDKKKYNIRDFPDKEFTGTFIKAISLRDKDKMMSEYRVLTNHVLNRMGGFNINGWKIRTPVDEKKKLKHKTLNTPSSK